MTNALNYLRGNSERVHKLTCPREDRLLARGGRRIGRYLPGQILGFLHFPAQNVGCFATHRL
jgi:hypothetical protein